MDSSFIPLVTGSCGALVVLAFLFVAFFTGRLHSEREFSKLEAENSELKSENDQLRDALSMERRTSDEIASTAEVTNKLISALTILATERRSLPRSSEITAEDLGL